jgi:AAA domain/Caspase domain
VGRHALLLGTATHRLDPELAPLPAVRHDVAQVKAALDYAGEFDSVVTHVDLTRNELANAIEEFYGSRRRGDLALLYYSGHGLLLPDQESLFLATTDTDHGRLHASAVDTAAVLKDMVARTYATQKVVILDCCFSGTFTAGNRFRGGLREEPRGGLRHPGTFILTSSTRQQVSFTQGPDRPSVFTEVLLDGLRGKAQPRDGSSWITTHDLSHFAQAEMQRRGVLPPAESSEGVTEPIPIVEIDRGAAAERSRSDDGRAALDGAGADATFDVDRWRQLIGYYAACIERSAVLGSFVDIADRDRYVPVPVGPEPVFAGAGAPVQLSDELAALAARTREGDRALRYGYPVVVRRPRSGRAGAAEFAPLLECDASVGPDGLLHTTMPPEINLALAADCGLTGTEIDDVTSRIEETFVPGDRSALAATIRQLSEVLGIPPAVPIDPGQLSGQIQRGPLRRLQNTAVLFATDAGKTPAGQLLEDLRKALAGNPGRIAETALGVLADTERRPAVPTDPGLTIVAPDLLNEAQEAVIRSAMSNQLTVAQGPPGTGKSQLVTALVATATAAGQTVLVGSSNNRAVSEVSDRCGALVGPGLIVRSGNKEYVAQEPELLSNLLAQHVPGAPVDERTPAAELRLARSQIGDARSELDNRRLLERDLAELATARGTAAALAVPLPTDGPALQRVIRYAERGARHRVLGWWSRRRLKAYGTADRDRLAELAHCATIELRWQSSRREVEALPDELDVYLALTEQIHQRRPTASRALLSAQVAARVRAGRAVLRRRCDEMSGTKPRSWSGFPKLLEALPAWAVTAMSARRLPPTPALFDLVVIDEAAACSIPAVLPLLFRAKRALIIGDPRQLPPVITLPDDEDRFLRKGAGLSEEWLESRRLVFGRHTAYDAFAGVAGSSHLLDEHYRCHPDIVAAPNREVYQDRLIVLTDPARLTPRIDPAVVWRDVPGQFSRGASGSGYNTAEVIATVAEVDRLRVEHPDVAIGVVTPLAVQAKRLADALQEAGHAEADVACGTAHRFQGGERDIMVVSAVGANGIADRTRSWLIGQANLWNVAITRAKAHLVIVGDRSWWSAQRGMLARIATGADGDDRADRRPTGPADALHAAALDAGLAVRRDVAISGHRYDLVIDGGTEPIAVVVDDPAGDADGRNLRTLLARLAVAGRTQPVRRAAAWRCLSEPTAVVAEMTSGRPVPPG